MSDMILYDPSSSSSSSCTPRRIYDVFLSFRGEDTRNTFTGHLHHCLCQKGVYTFIDDVELKRGEEISISLLHSIEESRISLIVFSENYANSSWCLDELVKIIDCKKHRGQKVWPIFYNADPSDVRKQTGSYKDAFTKHEERFKNDMGKVQRWKEALTFAGNLSGWHIQNNINRHEAKNIDIIVEQVLSNLNRQHLYIADCPVGIEPRVQDLNNLLSLNSDDVRIVGIYGIGGIGKTTITKAVYNSIAHQFEECSFIKNVREISKQQGLVHLQQTLLNEILQTDLKVGNVDKGINVIKERLWNKRVLIVLDDVDHSDQLKYLVGQLDWFSLGSRIIITTRDIHLLNIVDCVYKYKVEELDNGDAVKLFKFYGLRRRQNLEDYVELVDSVVHYAKGHPLALTVLGSFLCDKSISEWKSELEKLKRIPNEQICEVLKISYDGLSDNEKAIFLDIACFFQGKDIVNVMKILASCDLYLDIGIRVLVDKSLLTIERNGLWMHDLLQEMGKDIVRKESEDPGKRSRLWFHEDILQVLTENTGTNMIEAIVLDSPEPEELYLSTKAFKRMKRLRLFIVRNAKVFCEPICFPNELRWLDVPGYPLESLKFNYGWKKLVALHMSHSQIRHLGEDLLKFKNLKFMNFSFCESLTEIPDCSTIRNLERLILNGCTSLVSVHDSVGLLDKLVKINVENCSNLSVFPSKLGTKSLRSLVLSSCSKLETFPNIVGTMECIDDIWLDRSGIKELPLSIEHLHGVEQLNLRFCKNLTTLPSSIYHCKNLSTLFLQDCTKLGKFPKELSSSINGLPNLAWLDLMNCGLSEVDFLSTLKCFSSLKKLYLSENEIVTLPACISRFTNLECLRLTNCKRLQEIPELPSKLRQLYASGCESVERFSYLSSMLQVKNGRVIDLGSCHKIVQHEHINAASIFSSEELYMGCEIEMIFPGNEIPEWFGNKQEGGGSISFQVHSHLYEKISGLSICAVFELDAQVLTEIIFDVGVFVNGHRGNFFYAIFDQMEFDNVWMKYIPRYMICNLAELLENELTLIEIQVELSGVILKRIGVHLVLKEEERVTDSTIVIQQFSDPQSSIMVTEDESDREEDSNEVTHEVSDSDYLTCNWYSFML